MLHQGILRHGGFSFLRRLVLLRAGSISQSRQFRPFDCTPTNCWTTAFRCVDLIWTRLSLAFLSGFKADTGNRLEMADNESLAGCLSLPVDADTVTPFLERMRKQGYLILAENQASALLFVAIVLLGGFKMLMALLTDQRARQAVPQLGIGVINRQVAQLRILDESRIGITGNLFTRNSNRIVSSVTFNIIHPAVPIDSGICPILHSPLCPIALNKALTINYGIERAAFAKLYRHFRL
ncbi:hypothetical protein [uncultured Hoeflea sp.]|uniref:hypothetical protein n=1 Tax=uncultured Hoeflea sp. TaxID=538666 RepID=UPI0030DCA894